MIKENNWISRMIYMLLLVAILLVLFSIVNINLFHYYYGMNADIASEGILTKLIWDTKEWIPSSWYRATETRIFAVPNLAAIIYGLTKNITMSVGIVCSIFTMGIIGTGVLFSKALGFDKIQTAIFLLLSLILPNNLMIIDLFYLHASYYASCVIILFYTLAIYILAVKDDLNYGMGIIAFVLQVLYGTQGVRAILVVAGPLLVTEVLRGIYKVYTKDSKKYNWKILIWCISLLIGGFLGGLFPYFVGQSLSRNIRKAPEKFINYVLPDMMKSIGIQDASYTEKLFLILILICSLWFGIRILGKMINKKKIEPTEWGILVVFASPIATAVILTFTTIDSSGRYYFVFIFTMALSMAGLYKDNKKWIKVLIISFVGIITILNYKKVYVPMLNSTNLIGDDRYKVVEYMEEKEYSLAYTDFENANTMMLMAEGNIIVGAIDDFSEMNCLKWMTSTEWYVPVIPRETKTAYIVTEGKLEKFLMFCENNNAEVVEEIKIGKYYVFSSDINYTYID